MNKLRTLTETALIDLGRVADPLPEPQVPEPVTPEDAEARSTFDLWLDEHGLSRHELPPPELAKYQELERLESLIERKEGTAKHAPTRRDRLRIERDVEALQDRAEDLRAELGFYFAVTDADIEEAADSPYFCKHPYCTVRLRDANESWRQSGLCAEHFAAKFGGNLTDQRGRLL